MRRIGEKGRRRKTSRKERSRKQVGFAKVKERRSFMVAERIAKVLIGLELFLTAAAVDLRRFYSAIADILCDRRQRADTRPLAERSPQDRAQAAKRLPPR